MCAGHSDQSLAPVVWTAKEAAIFSWERGWESEEEDAARPQAEGGEMAARGQQEVQEHMSGLGDGENKSLVVAALSMGR